MLFTEENQAESIFIVEFKCVLSGAADNVHEKPKPSGLFVPGKPTQLIHPR